MYAIVKQTLCDTFFNKLERGFSFDSTPPKFLFRFVIHLFYFPLVNLSHIKNVNFCAGIIYGENLFW